MKIVINMDLTGLNPKAEIPVNVLHIKRLMEWNATQRREYLDRALIIERIADEKGVPLINKDAAKVAILTIN